MHRSRWLGSSLLLLIVIGIGVGLAVWKKGAIEQAEAASSNQAAPVEAVTVAVATERRHQPTTTAIGTVLALRSITLRNELPGTVRQVNLVPGQIVDEGTVLVGLDIVVEQAELRALDARAALAETTLARHQRLIVERATTETAVDQARAELDVARAEIARTKAIIERKTIRAPFRARVGIADVHPGQYLDTGTLLTTLQGVNEAVHVDFAVPQRVAAGLRRDGRVDVLVAPDAPPIQARIVAIDARVDPSTRNATVRARLDAGAASPSPGASVPVSVPSGPQQPAVVIPASALRKGPEGDHVFVLTPDKQDQRRATLRQVQSGPILGDEVLIYRGLSAGDQVATSGSFKLRDGSLVALARPQAPQGTQGTPGGQGTH